MTFYGHDSEVMLSLSMHDPSKHVAFPDFAHNLWFEKYLQLM